MNREIKFRAWDVYTQTMIDFDLEDVQQNRFSVRELASRNKWSNPIMQFIGLKDKNGKEIYEGDIIAYPMEGAKWVIDYKANFFYAKFVETNLKVYTYDLENRNYLQFEVVGNIYETPELIIV